MTKKHGTFRKTDTTVYVCLDDKDLCRHIFHSICRMLRSYRFEIGMDPRIEEHHKILSKYHRRGRHGDLEVLLEYGEKSIEIEFFQNVVHENPLGGQYDFSKLKKMPFLIRMKFKWIIAKLFSCLNFHGLACIPSDPSWHNDPLGAFNASGWCGRPPKWPTEDELRSWRREDGDGQVINQGEWRYAIISGRAMRVRVYGGINGMWHCLAPGIHSQQSAQSLRSVFPGRGRLFDGNHRRNRLNQALAMAVKSEDFLLAHRIHQARQRVEK